MCVKEKSFRIIGLDMLSEVRAFSPLVFGKFTAIPALLSQRASASATASPGGRSSLPFFILDG